jgi:hypothetical protein
LELDSRLLDGLEALRTLEGVVVIIHAGHRCPRYNAEVGGVPHSEHARRPAAKYLPARSLAHACTSSRSKFPNSSRVAPGFTMADSRTWAYAITTHAGPEWRPLRRHSGTGAGTGTAGGEEQQGILRVRGRDRGCASGTSALRSPGTNGGLRRRAILSFQVLALSFGLAQEGTWFGIFP